MKRARVKVAGLGLALFGGWAPAADRDWPGRPARPAVPPALLPASLREPAAPRPAPAAVAPAAAATWERGNSGVTDAVWQPAEPSAPPQQAFAPQAIAAPAAQPPPAPAARAESPRAGSLGVRPGASRRR